MSGGYRQRRGLLCGLWYFLVFLALAASASAQQLEKTTLEGMKWRLVGPFRGGRVEAVAGVPGTNEFFFGAVAGGVWKTTNAGRTWTPIFDKEPTVSIGALAVAPSDPNVIYVGTGEPCLRRDITYGNGMYKSTDGGATWTHIGLDDTRHIAKVIVAPRNPDVVLVAALGHAFGPNAERGVFRSTDGGKTWQKVLYKDENTGAVDLVFDPTNPRIVYAALYQVRRRPWTFSSGGPGSGIYKSVDEGRTWLQLEGHGLPAGPLGKIGLAVASGGRRVYALIEAKQGGLYVSGDAGANWNFVDGDHRFLQRAWYFTHIFADPKNADTVYILNTGLYRSTDGGHRWSPLLSPHADNHSLWIDPADPNRMILGDDGGAAVTTDRGKTWSTQDNQPTGQFYHVSSDNRFPYDLYGAQQDASSIEIAGRTAHGYIGRQDWRDVGDGESGYVVPDPGDPDIVYAGSYSGILTRFDGRTEQSLMISPWPVDPDGHSASAQKYRFAWTTPIAISPFDPNVIYFAAQVVFESINGGGNWRVISPDLSRNDKSRQGPSGGPITKDQSSAEYYDVISTLAASAKQNGLIWAGTDDGLIWITRDGGSHWQNVTPPDLPAWSDVSLIDPSPEQPGTAYAAVSRLKNDDLHPYVWKTIDYGKTWTSITHGLPVGAVVRVVREDPKRSGLLFAGTERGVYVSFDGGADWQPLKLNLPVVPVRDLVIHGDDLVIATHGRAFWILDDITPLRQMTSATLDAPAQLFRPAPAVRFRDGGSSDDKAVGENPPDGVILDYFLKEKPKDGPKLEILDAKGNVIRRFGSLTKAKKTPACPAEFPEDNSRSGGLTDHAGLNRFVWDMRYQPPADVPCAVYDEGGPVAPLALPGPYQVRLTVAGNSYTAPIEIVRDPRIKTSQADLVAQFDLLSRLRELMQQDHRAVLEIRAVRAQLESLRQRLGNDRKAGSVVASIGQIERKMSGVENALIQPNATAGEDMLNYPVELNSRLGFLMNAVDSADSAPPGQDWNQYEILQKQVADEVARWRAIVSTDISRLNQTMRREKIPIVAPPSGPSSPPPGRR